MLFFVISWQTHIRKLMCKVVFAVQGRPNFILNADKDELHQYISGIIT